MESPANINGPSLPVRSTATRSITLPIWQPTTPEADIPIVQYREHINNKFSLSLRSSRQLHAWSVTDPQAFWVDLWNYVGLVPRLDPHINYAYDPSVPMSDIPRFFEGQCLNYAENVLTQPHVDGLSVALVGIREGCSIEGEKWSWNELREHVRVLASSMTESGICPGDRLAAIISTSVWSVAIFLAAASIGAIYTSIASDLGEQGCTSRLAQVEPKLLFADSHVTFKGKQRSNLDKIRRIVSQLNRKPEVVVLPLAATSHSYMSLLVFQSRATSKPLRFKRLSFSAPLYILYSSGTSGPPKCLVHQHGVILQHKKVSKLHNSLKPGEVVYQYSSTSWVLWNIMVGHLAAGASLVLYDGSPTFPNPQSMLRIIEHHKVNYWGASPRYLQQLQATGVQPKTEYDLQSLRMVQSGGSHLAADQYHWFYSVFDPTVHLTSVTGGTDLVTSWICTDPAGPLYAGELQLPALGHDIDVLDSATGESVRDLGLAGEFVCRQPFPSMPIFMWNDKNNQQYKSAYFSKFDFPCWAQHDWISFNPVTGGSQVHGRSDGVLNPQGIRFGSAEIYEITEAHPFNEVIETSLCIGRRRVAFDADESVFLFVVMRDGQKFNRTLRTSLCDAIRMALSARHVPRFVFAVREIPLTVNGKKVETLVKQTICTGHVPERMSSTVANPGCLSDFARFYDTEDHNAAKL